MCLIRAIRFLAIQNRSLRHCLGITSILTSSLPALVHKRKLESNGLNHPNQLTHTRFQSCPRRRTQQGFQIDLDAASVQERVNVLDGFNRVGRGVDE